MGKNNGLCESLFEEEFHCENERTKLMAWDNKKTR
jgi:hypothetical protein